MTRTSLYSIPDGYVIIKPVPKEGEIRMQKAVRKDVLETMLARDLNMRLANSKKGYLTEREAEQRLHLDRIVDPSGHVTFSVRKIVEQHPIEFAFDGKHVVRAALVAR